MPWTNTLYIKQDAKHQTNFGLVKKLTLFLQEGWWGCSKRHSRGGDQTDQNFCCLHGGKPGSYLPQILTMENNTYVNSSPPLYICWSIGRRLKINRRNLSGTGDNDQQGKGKAEVGTRYASRHRREAWGGQLLLFFLFLRRWTSFSFFFWGGELFLFFPFLRCWTPLFFLFWGDELNFYFFLLRLWTSFFFHLLRR